MEKDLFADCSFGKIALKKFAPTSEDFRLYIAGWCGGPQDREVMKVTGGLFRRASRGPNKGKLSILVPKTSRSVYVTAKEMNELEAAEQGTQ